MEAEQPGISFVFIIPVIAISIIKQIDCGVHIAIIADTNRIRIIPICIQEFISIDIDCSTLCNAVKADEVMSKSPTIESAVAAAQNGETVTLLEDVTENVTIPTDKTITLDLNGKTLSGGKNNDKAALLNEGTVTIKDSSATKTGTIT